jgi:hypothetical protein
VITRSRPRTRVNVLAGMAFASTSAMKEILSLSSLLVVAAGAACGGSRERPERLSVAENLAEADRHDRVATEHEQLYVQHRRAESGGIHCYDRRSPDSSPGGEPTRVLRPCWTREQRPARQYLDAARAERKQAARHRAVAASLLRAERGSCEGLGQDEISHSPFFHREDILRVDEVRMDGELHGARVVYCPLMVAPTSATVEDLGGAIAVTIIARGDREIAAVVGRAKDLRAPAGP